MTLEDELPSGDSEEPWIWADAPGPAGEDGAYTGKWMLFVPTSEVDEVWGKVAGSTEASELGSGAKVSTRANNRRNRHAKGPDTHVICVYTRDCRDVADVTRVLVELRRLGFQGLLSYKEDGATLANRYGRGAALFVAKVGSTTPERRRDWIPSPREEL